MSSTCFKHKGIPLSLVCIENTKISKRDMICGICLSNEYMPYYKSIIPINEFLE